MIRLSGAPVNGKMRVSVHDTRGRLVSSMEMKGGDLRAGLPWRAPNSARGVFLFRVQGHGVNKTASAVVIR